MKLADLKIKIDEHNALIKKEGEQAIKAEFKELFARHPYIKKNTLTCYVTSWNDGNSVSFTIGEFGWEVTDKITKEETKLAINAIDTIEKTINSVKSVMEQTFGDGVKVTVTSKSFNIEEYDFEFRLICSEDQ